MYLKTDTVIKSYENISQLDIKNASILHIFFILKGCGVNDLEYVSVDIIGEKGVQIGSDLGLLYNYNESRPEKYEFINPFDMSKWHAQAVSEKLSKWVKSRIKNNIIGGATTWRKIIREDIYKGTIKFSNNYVDEIYELTLKPNKLNILAFAVWYSKFVKFQKRLTPNELIAYMLDSLSINEYERSIFFQTENNLNINYSEDILDMKAIREKIGKPNKLGDQIAWLEVENNAVAEPVEFYKIANKKIKRINMVSNSKIEELLLDNYQIIISGPPGTSKSFKAHQIAKKLSEENNERVLKVQFHPQMNYQEFIGGFIVKGENVVKQRGVLPNFIDKANESGAVHILIIEEINRANLSSVFGEVTLCLDRNYSASITIGGEDEVLTIPKNLLIIATMNTADKTLGTIDYALKRRFVEIYLPPNPQELIDTVEIADGISATDLLTKINSNLVGTLNNKELVIGQTIFYNDKVLDNDKFKWPMEKFEDLYNFKILPLIEDYCKNDLNQVIDIVGEKLSSRLSGENFTEAIKEFV